jgi:polar amino acid transport system substrate-binding protein
MGSGARIRAILLVGVLATVLWSVAAAVVAPMAHAQSNPLAFATDGRARPVLRGGWTLYEPYQFVEGEGTLTGIDTLISQDLAERLGYVAEFQYIDWADHVAGIREGTVDFASGATRTPERSEFAYFSVPYRFEDVVLIVGAEQAGDLVGLSTAEILEHFRTRRLRLGAVDGSVFGSDELNAYVAENRGTGLVILSESGVLNLRRLLAGEIDGFLDDRLSVINITWRSGAFDRVAEIALDSHSDIAMMFSKANFTPAIVDAVNASLAEMKEQGVIERITSRFLFPLLFSQTIGSEWYWAVDLVGTVAFALSGTILGWRLGANLAGFLILSALPAVGGGMARDILLDRSVASLHSLQNITIIGVISVTGYIAYRLHRSGRLSPSIGKEFGLLFNFFDAVGLGSFTVTGIAVMISDPNQYSIAWAPFIGVLTAAGGGIIRDTLVQRRVRVLFDDLYIQISMFWGALLTAYVYFTPARIEPYQYSTPMWATVAAIILTRMIWLERRRELYAI